MNARRAVLAVLVVAICVSGVVAWFARSDNTGGGPIPHQFDGETYPGTRFQATGEVVQTENGCLYVTVDGVRRYAVWPRGAAQDRDDARMVRLADGSRIGPGDRVDVTAAVFPISGLAGVPDGYWGSYTGYCAPGETDVLVIDTVAVVRAD